MRRVIALDGCDGVGKSTLYEALIPVLEEELERSICRAKHPARNGVAGKIREMLLGDVGKNMCKEAVSAFMLGEALHTFNVLDTTTHAETILFYDRYFPVVNFAYRQSPSFSINMNTQINTMAYNYMPEPELCLILDAPYEASVSRLTDREEFNHFDAASKEVYERRRWWFNYIVENNHWAKSIDATGTAEEVFESAVETIREYYKDCVYKECLCFGGTL